MLYICSKYYAPTHSYLKLIFLLSLPTHFLEYCNYVINAYCMSYRMNQ